MFRGPKINTKVSAGIGCSKGISDCMYASGGGCSAEWCIYEELPKMVSTSKELTCDICGESTKSVSVYSGINSYICDNCREKMKKIIKINNCSICGASTEPGIQICSSCSTKIKEKLNE